ncbi:hypothetical protein BH09MYX1_BH09MYX1_61710 [soil metagenome]
MADLVFGGDHCATRERFGGAARADLGGEANEGMHADRLQLGASREIVAYIAGKRAFELEPRGAAPFDRHPLECVPRMCETMQVNVGAKRATTNVFRAPACAKIVVDTHMDRCVDRSRSTFRPFDHSVAAHGHY